jgi:prephenate dehydrogenase
VTAQAVPQSTVPIAVLGCGLIGASAAAGWSGAGHEVWGCDRRDLAPLVARGWMARQAPVEALVDAGVVVLALPVGGILAALRRLPFRSGQLVTDVGSVKGPVMAAAQSLPAGVDFVGGHPLAGSAESGFEAARPDLFAAATWALVGPAEPAARVAGLVTELGAVPLACDAAAHDRAVALTSHLPQLLATAVAAELGSRDQPLERALLGPAGRDFLRIAGSSFEVWRDILGHNREEVERALAAVTARVSQPLEALEDEFELARRFAARLRDRHGRFAPSR